MRHAFVLAFLLAGLPTATQACAYASSWDTPAFYIVGYLEDYREGDFAEALKGFQCLAEQGDATSQYYLGLMYSNGQAVSKDEVQAMQWYQKSAQQDYAKAQNNLGDLYYYGRGVAKDIPQARIWYQKAADQGLAVAQRNLGASLMAYEPHSDAMAMPWLKKAALQGNDADQLVLAFRYAYGGDGVRDPAKAAYWLRKAARQGIAGAQTLLGERYRSGNGVPKDPAKAMYWLRRAASQGDSLALHQIGGIYRLGEGVPKDHAESVRWYCQAAKKGSSNAMYILRVGDKPSIECLKGVAEQGRAVAQQQLGRWYENDSGTVHDYPNATVWYRKAAEQGEGFALYNLGDLYAQGHGLPEDPVLAKMLYILGGVDGHSSRIKQPLTESQLNEAKELAGSWKKGTPLPEQSKTGRPAN